MPAPQAINDALVAVSVLLVFVIAYFSTLYPVVQQKLKQEPPARTTPEFQDYIDDLTSYKNLMLLIAVLAGLILLLISRYAWDILLSPSRWWPWSRSFILAYGALMLVSLFLLGLLCVLAGIVVQIVRRRGDLTKEPSERGPKKAAGH